MRLPIAADTQTLSQTLDEESLRRKEEWIVGVRGAQGHKENIVPRSNQAGLIGAHLQPQSLHGSALGSLHIICCGVLVEFITLGVWLSLTLLPALGTLFLLLDFLVQPCCKCLCPSLIASYYAMFGYYSWRACSFLKGNWKAVDLGQRRVRLGGVETAVWYRRMKYSKSKNKGSEWLNWLVSDFKISSTDKTCSTQARLTYKDKLTHKGGKEESKGSEVSIDFRFYLSIKW